MVSALQGWRDYFPFIPRQLRRWPCFPFSYLKTWYVTHFPSASYYSFVFLLDSNLLTWTRQRDIQSDGKSVLSISPWCFFQKRCFEMILTGYSNWTMPGTSYGVFGRVISESDDSKAWYQFQIQLRIDRINTDNNFSEGKSQ